MPELPTDKPRPDDPPEPAVGEPGQRLPKRPRSRDPRAITLVGAGMLTILASVLTLFVDKLSLPLYVSLMIGLIGIGLAGSSIIIQADPEHWPRPVAAVVVGTLALVAATYILVPRTNAAGPEPPAPVPTAATIDVQPDHGRIDTSFIVSGRGCPNVARQITVYFDGKALFPPPTCLADHTFRASYSPDASGSLTWFDGQGSNHNMTLAAGASYTVYAQTVAGEWVTSTTTYFVG
jgi:hypothetical protein